MFFGKLTELMELHVIWHFYFVVIVVVVAAVRGKLSLQASIFFHRNFVVGNLRIRVQRWIEKLSRSVVDRQPTSVPLSQNRTCT